MNIRWHHTFNPQASESNTSKAALDCQASGVESVRCQVYDASGNWLVSAGPWPCSVGGANVDGIPVGSDRIFVVLAEDNMGGIRYQGQAAGITIAADEVTEDVVIDAYPFLPSLHTPENGAEIDPNAQAFEWESLINANEYLIQVAEDIDFETIIINEIIFDTSYAPSALLPSMEYFWRVNAFDPFGNMGAASEVWSLATSDCTYTISSLGNDVGAGGGSGSFDVASSAINCRWSASTVEEWIEITSGTDGSGDGQVSYRIAANPLSEQRRGVITVGGRQYGITQEGTPCTYQISPGGEVFSGQGGAGTITVSASAGDCPWSASTGQEWIEITSGGSGIGGGQVGYRIAANPLSGQRSGGITVGGQRHEITQEGTSCSYQISPDSDSFSSQGGTGTITVTASASDCTWNASVEVEWIQIISAASGTGSGEVAYRVLSYAGDGNREADIGVAGRTCRVTQSPAPDTINPSVNITVPTSDPNFTTTSATLAVGGTAADNIGVAGLSWANSQGGSGACTGTEEWRASGIALVAGENVITITAQDAAGNTGMDTLTVNYEIPAPDYIINDLAVNPAATTAGSAITTEFSVVNQGGAPQGCVNMALFLSVDAEITSDDLLLENWQLPDCNVASGQSIPQSRQITIPAGTSAGDYYVGAVVDVDGYQSESDESNNTAAIELRIDGAPAMPCSTTTEAGQDTAETFVIEMGQNAGTFILDYQTYSQQDNIIVAHDGVELWRTGCVGASGSQPITYSGNSTQITVQVEPNCYGGSGTSWEFTVHCPELGGTIETSR